MLELFRSPSLGVVAKPGENERDFRVRLQHAAREARDEQVAGLRQKYAPKMLALAERQRKAEQAVAREQEQVASSRVQTGISLATTVFGAMFGRKTFSASTLGRATTAARGVGRSMKESQDVGRAQENVAAVQAQKEELEAQPASGDCRRRSGAWLAGRRDRDHQPEAEAHGRPGKAGGANLGGTITAGG